MAFSTHKRELVASGGVVCANHPLASAAGIEMLSLGGNAFDAAVSSLFALTVVEPMMVGIFGAGFFVCREGESGEVWTLDNYAVAPEAAREDMYRPVEEREPGQYLFETEGRRNMVGYLSVATPGSLKGWEHVVESHGSLPLSRVMEPAIGLARDGYRASRYLVHWVDTCRWDLEMFPDSAKILLPGRRPLREGDVVRMPDYAESLEKIAEEGSDVLYGGSLGEAVVESIEENGGILTMEDMESYSIREREPVEGTYRGHHVYSMAPGSSGGAHIIQMLNVMEMFDLASMGFGSPDHLHLLAETMKIAFSERQEYMGDPDRVEVPLAGLTSKLYARERGRGISLDRAGRHSHGEPGIHMGTGRETPHVSVVDSEGNIVAATQTLFSAFGSRATARGTGIMLNNCMGLFDPNPDRSNSVEGGKRMLSSMAPTILTRDGDPFMCLGTPGGTRIFPSVCQAIMNVIDFDMTIQEAVEAPRVWTMGIEGTDGEKLHMESGFGEDAMRGLRERGHEVLETPRIAGGMNGILIDRDGWLHGGACWRADGTPMGISGGWAHPKAFESLPMV